MKKRLSLLLAVIMTLAIFSISMITASAAVSGGTWNEDQYIVNGSPVYGTWVEDGGNWYYVDYSGYKVTDDLFYIDGDYDDGEYYLFDENGVMQTGWHKHPDYNNEWIYLKSSGVMETNNWVKDSAGWCYLGYDGLAYRDGTYYFDGHNYYFDEGGHLKTGWIKETYTYEDYETGEPYTETEWYYADSDGRLVTGWKKIDGAWYYFDQWGEMYSDDYYYIDSYRYEFAANGKMKTGWVSYALDYDYDGDGKNDVVWYYYNPSSGRAATGWKKIDNVWYYFDDYGELCTGRFWIDDTLYVADKNGKVKAGWVSVNYERYDGMKDDYVTEKRWYYTDENGEPYTNCWKKIDGKQYYFTSSGMMASNGAYDTSLKQDEYKFYVFNKNGQYQTGWASVTSYYDEDGDGKYDTYWYYCNSNGVAKRNTWAKISGAWYYFDYYGEMATYRTWVYNSANGEEDLYFFGKDGKMRTNGWNSYPVEVWDSEAEDYVIETRWCYAKSNGKLACEQWLKDGGKWYYFGESGYMYYDDEYYIDGYDYYFNKNGTLKTGWVEINYGDDYSDWKYYDHSTGNIAIGWKQIAKKWYYFNSNGYMCSGLICVEGDYYYLNDDGVMQTGWQEVYGDWYWFNTDGTAKTGWCKSGETWYYFYNDGVMASDATILVGGKPYTFDSEGRMV